MAHKEIAEISFDNTTKFTENMLKALEKFLRQFGIALEEGAKDAPQKALAKWIKQGKGVRQHPVQGGCMGEMQAEMRRLGIAYVACKNDVFIVKQTDIERVRELNHDILLARTNYFQEAEIKDFEDAIANFSKQKNKDVLTLHGLDEYTLEVIKNKSNNIAKGFTVAHSKEKDKDTYSACVSAARVISLKEVQSGKRTEYKKDFCRATLETMLSLYGPNEEIKKQQIRDDEAFDKKIQELKNNKKTHYIVGEFNKDKVIEITAEGFTFYDYKRKNSVISQISKDDINYEGELQVAMDCIYNKILISGPDKYSEYMNKETNADEKSERTVRNKAQADISIAEKDVAIQIDRMIKDRLIKEGYVGEDGSIKISTENVYEKYLSEASKILTSLKNGEELKDYNKEDIEKIKKTANHFRMEFSAYGKSIEKLTEYSFEVHKARPYKNKEKIQEDISRMKKARGEDRLNESTYYRG